MRVLIIGLGSIAKKHIQALRVIDPDVEIYALRSSPNASEFSGVNNLFDLNCLRLLNIDFAIVSNPTSLHKSAILDLLPYNIPLFIEKPVFSDINVDSILAEIKKNQIPTYVACNLRFLGSLKYVKELIADQRINEVNIYCGSYLPDWRPGANFRNVYSSNFEMGGGVHLDLIHEIDYMYWLFGSPISVAAKKTHKSSLGITAFDYANFLFEYPDFSINTILNYYRRDSKRSLEVITDESTIYADLLRNEVVLNDRVVFKSEETIASTYVDQLRFFIFNVLNDQIKFNTVDEAVEILKLCLAKD